MVVAKLLTLFLLALTFVSADNLCKLFGHRSGLTVCRFKSGSKMFDTLIVFLIELFEKKLTDNNKTRNCVCEAKCLSF